MLVAEVRTGLVFVHTAEEAKIHAPIDKVNVAECLLNLPDAEYRRCAPPDHIAAGSATTDDGRPMSINVEEVGGSLVLQHYVAEVHEAHHCQVVSLSDPQSPLGRNKIQVIRDLRVAPLDAESCQLTNVVISHPTQPLPDMLEAAGQTFEETADLQAAVVEHNRLETPSFAASIARKTLNGGARQRLIRDDRPIRHAAGS